MRTGYASLPLHPGRAPKWLFSRMTRLSKLVTNTIISEFGEEYFLKRLSNPFWFQSLGCVLGYDWHSSGLSTVLTGALKISINAADTNIKVAGGKGKTSLKTPEELEQIGRKWQFPQEEIDRIVYTSRMVAKVDNSLVQDSYSLYHHSFFISKEGGWTVVQQGMNDSSGLARRYHWNSDINSLIEEPHSGIDGTLGSDEVLNMTSGLSEDARKLSVEAVSSENELSYALNQAGTLTMPRHHIIGREDLTDRVVKELGKLSTINPRNYEELVSLRGVGPKTIRALALISELVYGGEASWEDPVKFSYAHGGKDGTPRKVNLEEYDETISTLKNIIDKSHMDGLDRMKAFRRLGSIGTEVDTFS